MKRPIFLLTVAVLFLVNFACSKEDVVDDRELSGSLRITSSMVSDFSALIVALRAQGRDKVFVVSDPTQSHFVIDIGSSSGHLGGEFEVSTGENDVRIDDVTFSDQGFEKWVYDFSRELKTASRHITPCIATHEQVSGVRAFLII